MAAELLTAAEAAAELGVSRRTLYAYVSRGLLRSQPGPGPSRERRYPRSAIDALRRDRSARESPERAAQDALHWGLPVLDSALTLIEDGRLWYRGHDAVELSRSASFEQVVGLLWRGTLETAGVRIPAAPADGRKGGVGERMAAALLRRSGSSVGASRSDGADPPVTAAAKVLADLFAAAGGAGDGPLATRLARAWRSERVDVIEVALVLCADHELNVSAFTARTVASADARIEHVLLAALCAIQGRRHGGMVARCDALLEDAGLRGTRGAADRAVTLWGTLPGFGHPLYPDGDPRAQEILRRLGELGEPERDLVRIAFDDLGARPTLDFALAVLERRLALPPESGLALFVLGRAAGWVAHAFETWSDARLIRPRSRYVGPRPGARG